MFNNLTKTSVKAVNCYKKIRDSLTRFFVFFCLLSSSCAVTATVRLSNLDNYGYLNFHFSQAGAQSSGKFKGFSVELEVSEGTGEPQALNVEVDINTLSTDDNQRDEMLHGLLFFYSTKYPTAKFESTKVHKLGGKYVASGNLTIRDVTKKVDINFTLNSENPSDAGIKYLRGEAHINRLDFDIGLDEWEAETFIGNSVRLDYKVAFKG